MADWAGNLPSWMSAIAASCALIFTSWTAYNSQRSARASEKQAQIATEQNRRLNATATQAQASVVAAWVEQVGSSDGVRYELVVANNSVLPVYSVWAHIVSADEQQAVTRHVVAPSNEPIRIPLRRAHEALDRLRREIWEREVESPESYEHDKDFTFLIFLTGLVESYIVTLGVDLVFRDAQGLNWRRRADGVLENISEPTEGVSWVSETLKVRMLDRVIIAFREKIAKGDLQQ